MKKIISIISILFLSIFTQVSAIKIDFSDNQVFRPSQWIVALWDLSVKIENNLDITKDKWFSLIIPDEARFRLSSEQNLSFSWTWSSKIISWYTINPEMTKLSFKVSDDFKFWDDFSISWLKVVIYDRQSTQNIWIDINSDGIADIFSSYYIRVNDVLSYHDDLAPSEVFDFTWNLNLNTLTLNGKAPGDIDFQAFQIYTYDASWNKLRDYFTPLLNNYTIDTTNLSGFVVKTVDYRANYSTWLTFKLSDFKWLVDNSISSENTQTWILVSTGQTSLTTDTWVVKMIDKLLPTFKTKSFNDFMIVFDSIIDKKTYKEETRIIRNKIIQLLKDYEDKKVTKIFTVTELKKLIISFKSAF